MQMKFATKYLRAHLLFFEHYVQCKFLFSYILKDIVYSFETSSEILETLRLILSRISSELSLDLFFRMISEQRPDFD